MASNVTDKSFGEEVLKSNLPVLVDFWAEWCGPCRMLTPIIEEVSKELENKVKVLKMNIVDDSEIPSKLGIKSIPTLILFKDGEQLDIKVGIKQNNPKQEILDWIENNIKY